MIGGIETPIHSDFRSCLRVILAFEDNDLTTLEKQMVLLTNLYPEPVENIRAAIEQGMKFLNGGKDNIDEEDSLRLYSFERDAPFIFSAFRQTHGIDLETADLHWWKFLALFMDLGSDTAFCNLIGLRKRVKTGKATKEEKETAREMGNMFDVPEIDIRTLEEREQEAEFMRLIGGK